MTNINGTWSFIILRGNGGNVTILDVVDIGAGVILENPRKLTVSGPGIAPPPKNEMNLQEYSEWLTQLRNQGFETKESDMK
ncbi:MAG: hypothetical protein WC058_09025 [Phycisphaeraceae bacterium]